MRVCSSGSGGAIFGCSVAQPRMYRRYRNASRKPGNIAAA
jgi:hypothetical protein